MGVEGEARSGVTRGHSQSLRFRVPTPALEPVVPGCKEAVWAAAEGARGWIPHRAGIGSAAEGRLVV